MFNCISCGKNMGFLPKSVTCDTCRLAKKTAPERKQTEERAEAERYQKEQRQLALVKFNKHKDSLLVTKLEEIRTRTQNGEKIFLYDNIYVPVDSIVNKQTLNDEFSISIICRAGLQGWEVIGIVPRTIGVGLTNSSIGSTFGETWGAGLGGNVMGVHVMLKKELSSQNTTDDFLLEYIGHNIDAFLTSDEKQIFSDLLEKTTK